MTAEDASSDDLQELLAADNHSAVSKLMARYRDRLRRMVSVRMDVRLSSRFDPSDVVQEALMVAANRLPEYLRERSLPLYPWLRQITFERLVDLHHHHLTRQKRSVARERRLDLPDESAVLLANQLIEGGSTPSQRLLRQEMRERVQAALGELNTQDREILVMRDLERMKIVEIAAVLEISESAVKMRRLRAVARLREALDETEGGAR